MSSPPNSKQRRSETSNGRLIQHALVEVRPRLQSGYCFLRLTVDTADSTFRLLSVETRCDQPSLEVCLEYRGLTYCEPVPVPCRLAALDGPVTVAEQYAMFRLRLEPDQRRGSAAAEILAADQAVPPSPPPPLWRPAVGDRYRASCRQCGAVVADTLFRRVLPLPSANFREMLGNIFCHADGADQDLHERVRARPGDCLYAVSYLVVSLAEVESESDGGRLSCAGCAAPLGDTIEFGARLWHHRLTWSSAGAQQLRLQPDQVLRLLLRGAPTTRVLATAPRHDPLLIWLLETRLTVHTATHDDGGATRTALKILHRRCDEEEAQQHRADLEVQVMELDDVLMAVLRGELERSQRWYPESQRTVGEYQVGLLLL